MSLKEIIDVITSDGAGWFVIIIGITSLIEVSPIKLNPFQDLGKFIRNIFTKELTERVESLESNMAEVKAAIDKLDDADLKGQIKSTRMVILGAAREIKKDGVTDAIDIEYLSEVIKQCDWYEQVCEENDIPNGVAKTSIAYLRDVYKNLIL